MFDIEIENDAMTQGRHIESDAAIVIWHGTTEYEVTPGFDSNTPLDVNDHQAVESVVADFRKFLAERNRAPRA
jgi:hypothetical protein